MVKDTNKEIPTLENNFLNAAFFVRNVDLSDKLEIASKLNKALRDVFDGDPTLLPIQDDAPLELPRIILNSKYKLFSCSISPERIDFVINKSKLTIKDAKPINIEEEFFKNTKLLITVIIKLLQWNIHRIALISQFTIKPEGGVIPFLQNMLSPELGGGAKELQLHSLKSTKINDFKSNHWLRLLSQNAGTDQETLLIISDLNTVQGDKLEMTEENSELFFEEGLKMTKESIIKIL